ncbi:MAG: UMP kinase, partial [Sweet potato little leaf phytoplasma]|nr:UMP kinase [Sweet potato little leaf phytoplasma]
MLSKILLKLSGEALKGEKVTIDPQKVKEIAKEIKEIKELGVQIVIIIGAGNIWRGITGQTLGMKRDQSDYMGMLGTIVNALALQDALENLNIETRVMTSFQVLAVAEPYIKKRADHHLDKKRVIILSGGFGVPFFSTDTSAALRDAELGINLILMAKNNVKGVYT